MSLLIALTVLYATIFTYWRCTIAFLYAMLYMFMKMYFFWLMLLWLVLDLSSMYFLWWYNFCVVLLDGGTFLWFQRFCSVRGLKDPRSLKDYRDTIVLAMQMGRVEGPHNTFPCIAERGLLEC